MWVNLQSDAALAATIVSKNAAAAVPVVGLGAAVPGNGTQAVPFRLPASALEVLLAVGRATAAVGPTPAARFQTVGWWAVLRWFWTLDTAPGGQTDLTDESDEVRNHHRTAFSEAMGLASALLLAERLLAAGAPAGPLGAPGSAPVVVDIDSITTGSGPRPDLWVLASPPLIGQPFPANVLLEAKGRCDVDALTTAMAGGVRQVGGVAGAARRVVVGAAVPRTTFTAAAVEVPVAGPPAAPAPSAAPAGPPSPGSTPSAGVSPSPVGDDDGGAPLGSAKDLLTVPADVVAAADAKRLATFASLDLGTVSRRRALELVPGHTVDFEGASIRLRHDEREFEVSVGLLGAVADGVRSAARDPERALRSVEAVREQRGPDTPDDGEAALRGVVAADGCVLSVRRL